MPLFLRAILTFVTWVAVSFFSFWMIFAQILPEGIASFITLVFASAVAWYVWRKSRDPARGGLASHVLLNASIVGAIGFVLGFFGPMILAPGANQGPLLGLLITGPLGFAGGAVVGAIRWAMQKRHT
ncbi:MAG: hypothetical protein AB7L76_23450 [Burkholderiaceae bacterium]